MSSGGWGRRMRSPCRRSLRAFITCSAGDALRVQVNGADRSLHVGFILRTSGASALDPHFAAMDIGWAQEFFGRRGVLSSIQVQLTQPRDRDAVSASLRSILPPDARVATPAQRGEQVQKMLGGFELNLTAMSLVSLLVGMFLIYNTVSASVVRRRSEIGILRSLGTTRNEVRALFLAEAFVLGVIGVVVGSIGGLLLARVLVGTVSETISSLYVLLSVREVAVTPWMFGSAALLGLVSVMVAAWLPAAAAAKMDPVRALRAGSIIEQSADLSPAWFWLGLIFLGGAGVLSFVALTTGPPWIAFGAAFCVLAGFSFMVPGGDLALQRWREPVPRGCARRFGYRRSRRIWLPEISRVRWCATRSPSPRSPRPWRWRSASA